MNKNTQMIIGVFTFTLGIIMGVLGLTLKNNFFHEEQTTTPKLETIEDYLYEVLQDYAYYYQNDELLNEGALKGIMESLGDPYSVYLNTAMYADFSSEINGSSTGVGIYLTVNGDYPIITNVVVDSPAFKAGLKSGDTIISIDHIDLKNLSRSEIGEIIQGEKGTKRTFKVYQGDKANIDTIEVTLDDMIHRSVKSDYFIKDQKRVGYVKISSFTSITYTEFLSVMTGLERKNIDCLIIDVRDNPGGLLDSVMPILDYFINSDEPFMFKESRDGVKTPYYLDQTDLVVQYDIAVLMNENSASAAEIFASTMNEQGGVPLVGTTTYGKGTMQSIFPLNITHTKQIKLTTDIWLTPSGNWINGVGIKPTVAIDLENFKDLSYIDPSQTYAFDQVSKEIKDVQVFLNRKGFDIRSDGYLDKETQEAIKTYQETKQIPVTGLIDTKTAYSINCDMIEYVNNPNDDNQYTKALELLLAH